MGNIRFAISVAKCYKGIIDLDVEVSRPHSNQSPLVCNAIWYSGVSSLISRNDSLEKKIISSLGAGGRFGQQ